MRKQLRVLTRGTTGDAGYRETAANFASARCDGIGDFASLVRIAFSIGWPVARSPLSIKARASQ